MRFTAEVVREYNRWMSEYVEAWSPGTVDGDKASLAGFMCNAISSAVQRSSHDGLKAQFEEGAYLEYKNVLYLIEHDNVTGKFEGRVVVPPPADNTKMGYTHVRTIQYRKRADADDSARRIIHRLGGNNA